ncbi:ribonuclease P protein component [Cryobacterium sp. BB307]|uniref:ribonuclease P protein component n=1 Tax=Cryobacterium sp. BB307 TaxID=2716317 RepID=UPI001446F9F6
MLAGRNRLVTADDFKSTLRRGRRFTGSTTVVHVASTGESRPPRFGFIITRKVGNAVKRNLVRRRLRALCYRLLPAVAPGTDVVVRALPGSEQVPSATLHKDVVDALSRSLPN